MDMRDGGEVDVVDADDGGGGGASRRWLHSRYRESVGGC